MVVFEVIGKVALWVPSIEPAQLSVAVGAVKLVTSHSSVIFVKVIISAIGAVLSATSTLKLTSSVFPMLSVAVNVMEFVVPEIVVPETGLWETE